MQDTPVSLDKPAFSHKQRWALGALIAVASASVVLSLSAWAGNEGGGGMARCMPHMGMPGEPGSMPFGGRHLQRLLDDVGASEAQRTQIRTIADKAQADLKTLREQGRSLHEQGLKVWAAPKIDAAAAEKTRQQMLTHHDQISKRMMQAMLDVGAVLTPEQRAKVALRLQKHHDEMVQHMGEGRGEGPGERHGAHHGDGPDERGERGERQPVEK
jgi:protein CpxP